MLTNGYTADFQMVGNRIVQLKLDNDFISMDTDNSNKTKKALKLTHCVEDVATDEKGRLSGLLQLEVAVRLRHEKRKCVISLKLEGCFDANADLGEERFRKMLEMNGVATLYSIARSIMLSVSAQAFAQGTVILPMINVLKYSEVKKAEEKKLAEKNSTK